jgi:hypothetical protein
MAAVLQFTPSESDVGTHRDAGPPEGFQKGALACLCGFVPGIPRTASGVEPTVAVPATTAFRRRMDG